MSTQQPPLEPWTKDVSALLDAERSAPDPVPDVSARVWSAVASATAAGAAGASASSSPLPARALGMKAGSLVVAALLGGVVGAGLHAAWMAPRVEVVMVDRPVLVTVAAPVVPAVSVAVAPVVTTPAPEARAITPGKKTPTAPVAVVPVAAPVAPSSLEEESALLDQARQALARSNHKAALDALLAHRARFAAGTFAEERDALEVRALLATGEPALAGAAAKAFLNRYPSSIHRAVMERAAQAN